MGKMVIPLGVICTAKLRLPRALQFTHQVLGGLSVGLSTAADSSLEALAFQHLRNLFLEGPEHRGELLTVNFSGTAGKTDRPGAVGVFEVIHVGPVVDGPAFLLAVQVIDDVLKVGLDGAGLSGSGKASDEQVVTGFVVLQTEADCLLGPVLAGEMVKGKKFVGPFERKCPHIPVPGGFLPVDSEFGCQVVADSAVLTFRHCCPPGDAGEMDAEGARFAVEPH